MKKSVFTAALALALLLSACSAPAASEPAAAQTAAPEAPAAYAATVGVAMASRRGQMDLDMEAGMKAYAAENDLELIIKDADTDPARQSEQLKEFAAAGVDAVAVCATNAEGIADALAAVTAAGIPIVSFDVDAAAPEQKTFVGYDYSADGSLMAAWMADYINAKMGGAAKVGIIDYANCKAICQRKLKALYDDLRAACPGVVWTGKVDGNGQRAASMDAAEKLLKDAPDTQILIVVNASSADGVRTVLKDMKREDILLMGSGYGDALFSAMAEGDPVYAAFTMDPAYELGMRTLESAWKVISGGTTDARQILPATVITAGNITDYDYKAVAAQRGE